MKYERNIYQDGIKYMRNICVRDVNKKIMLCYSQLLI